MKLEKACEHTLLILPVRPCVTNSSSSSLLVKSSSFLAHLMNSRVRASSNCPVCGCGATTLLEEMEINMCRLNNMTVKDAYSLPKIQEMLQCICGAIWFTSLNLKLGYWQVRMKECKAYMAFTVGLLGLYKWKCMAFWLTNASATFQHLMETCLGELQLNWCIIYLGGIIAFATIPKELLERL